MFFPGLKVRIALVLIGGFFIFGCAREPVVARVNGEAITKKEIAVLLKHGGIKEGVKESPEEAERRKAIRQELLNQIINEKLVLQTAKKENIKVDKKEVMNAYTNIVRSFPKEDDYLKKLKERGMSKDTVLKSIEKDLTVRKFKDSLSKDITISDKELKDYYDKNLETFTTPEQLRLSVIKVNSIEEAKKIKRKIGEGANFEEMAMKYPAGHTGPGAGETGWVTIDSFPSDMAKEIKKIRAGAFGGPIKGREGYYLIKVKERREKKVLPFDEVKMNIRHILTQQKKEEKFQAWLREVRNKAKIEIFEKG